METLNLFGVSLRLFPVLMFTAVVWSSLIKRLLQLKVAGFTNVVPGRLIFITDFDGAASVAC